MVLQYGTLTSTRPHLEYGATVWNPHFNKTALRVWCYSMEPSLQHLETSMALQQDRTSMVLQYGTLTSTSMVPVWNPHLEYGATVWNPHFNKTALEYGATVWNPHFKKTARRLKYGATVWNPHFNKTALNKRWCYSMVLQYGATVWNPHFKKTALRVWCYSMEPT